MMYEISEEIINGSGNCNSSFSCLFGVKDCLCEVDDLLRDVLFVKRANLEFCNYRMHFGNSIVCICPVRRELYNLYKI